MELNKAPQDLILLLLASGEHGDEEWSTSLELEAEKSGIRKLRFQAFGRNVAE